MKNILKPTNMKFTKLILSSLLLVLTIQMTSAQLYIDAEGNGGLGVQTSPHAKLTVDNSIENTSLKILNKTNASTTKIGLSIEVDNIGTAPRYGVDVTLNQNTNSDKEIIPFRANVKNYGSGTATGFMSILEEYGTGVKNGFFCRLTQPIGATGTIKGAYNEITQNGTSTHAYGIHNLIYQNGNTDNTYGISNYINQGANKTSYGINNRVDAGNATSATTYGSYNYVQGSGAGEKVAIYAQANGPNNTAAKFHGQVYINGALYQASDEQLKDNITDLTGALLLIEQIKPKKYKFKESPYSGSDSKLQHYGFLAQEFEEVLPDQVKEFVQTGRTSVNETNVNGSKTIEYEQLEPDETIKTVNYIALIPILTQAIKEQQVIIKDLEARLKLVELGR